MISPDKANLGVRASFVFAGQVVLVLLLVYFFYPEVHLSVSMSGLG